MPLVVHERDARRGERVTAACPRAAQAGVRDGLPLTEAVALLARRPPTLVPHDPAGDLAALARLAEFGLRFSPFVGWETLGPRSIAVPAPPPAHLFFDLTGVAGLFGGEPALAQAIVDAFAAEGFTGRLAIAGSLGAAWALAGVIAEPWRIETDAEAALGSLPLDRLRLPAEPIETLRHLGIGSIGQLRELSRVGVAERFGPLIGLRLDQVLGEAEEWLVPHQPAVRHEVSCELDYPAAHREVIDYFLRQLLDQLVGPLAARGVGAVTLSGLLRCVDAGAVEFEVSVFRATHDPAALAELLRLKFDRLHWPGPVREILLRVDRTAPVGWRAGDLFDEEFRDDPEWDRLVERLASRLGFSAIGLPTTVADPVPERSYRYLPAGQRPRARGSMPFAIGHRPWMLLDPAEPIRVSLSGIAPAGFEWRRDRHTVARHWGPERIESGWWRGEAVRRDYYRVETAAGRRFWLYRNLAAGDWYLHGCFG